MDKKYLFIKQYTFKTNDSTEKNDDKNKLILVDELKNKPFKDSSEMYKADNRF